MTWTLSAFADEAGGSSDEQIEACNRGGLKITDLPLELAQQLKNRLDEAGIEVAMYGSPIGKIDIADDLDIDLRKLEHLGCMRDVFGCNRVRMFSYYNRHGATDGQWRDEVMSRLEKLKAFADNVDLALYHENESEIYGDASDRVLEIAQLREKGRFELIYDFANYIRTGEDGWVSWTKLADRTDCFHFKDQRKDNQHVPMGQGETDLKKILADAASRGWDGPCTLEPHLTHSQAVLATHSTGSGDQSLADLTPAETFQIAVQSAQQLLDELKIDYR